MRFQSGHHHYIHAWDHDGTQFIPQIHADQAAKKSKAFYDALQSQNRAAMNITTLNLLPYTRHGVYLP